MYKISCFAVVIICMILSVTAHGRTVSSLEPIMKANNLRCEYRSEPLGIDSNHPRFSWIPESAANAKDQYQTSYRVIVASSSSILAKNRGDLWDSGVVRSSKQNNIVYAGSDLRSGQQCFWKVCLWHDEGYAEWSKPATFEMGLLHPSDWVAKWICDGKKQPVTDADFYKDDPAPLFRKVFSLRKPIKNAKLYITGLGYYEASINGARIGDHVLDPGWTRFEKRTLYSVYDVTSNLQEGENCIGAMLGNGWYNPLPLRLFGTFNLRDYLAVGRPKLIAQLHIEYTDGTSEIIGSDETWKVGESPILRNSIYLGEVYDARKEQTGWDKPGFDDSNWRNATLAQSKTGMLVSQSQPPIRVRSQWNAIKQTEPKPKIYIYDLGVNFAGWVSLSLNMPAGTEIKLRYGELLNADGTLNPMTSVAGQIKGLRQGTQESIGGPGAPPIAWQTDTYIAKGRPETYTPRFTFHGCRYLEITGLDAPLPVKSVTAMALCSDVEDAGTFECSNPMLNNIQEVCRRTFLSNIFSVQSDCPHRERLGYGGDIVATSEAFMSNFNMAGFYAKAVRDWSDSALPGGMFTDTAPYMGIQYCGVVWAMAHPLLVDQLYRYYGDRKIDDDEYEAAKRWMSLVEKQYPDGIVTEGLSDHEGLAPAPAPEMVTPLYYQCAKLMEAAARRLSKVEDAAKYLKLGQTIREAYVAKFVDQTTGKVGPGTQTSQAIGLYTGIVPDSIRSKSLTLLLRDIEEHKGHLTTGILGTKFMLDVLSREGRADVAYQVATQPSFPGWGWMLMNGATTLWEHWEFSDNTFSHNHPMFGSVSQWMMQWLGGIQPEPDAEGFDRICIRPQTPVGLDWVKSSYKSIRGDIVSNWKRKGKTLTFDIVVPANSTARVCLPAKSVDEITEDGKKLSRSAAVIGAGVEFNVGSGHYSFNVKLK